MTINSQPARTAVFLYASDPNPGLLERMKALHDSGLWNVHAIYWHRLQSNISIPFTSKIPAERFHPIGLPDPRGAVPRRVLLTFRFLLAVRRLLRQIKPDSIHAVNADILAIARLALLGSGRTALVYDMQDQMGDDLPWYYRFLYRRILRRADCVLIRSEGFIPFIEKNRLVGGGRPVHYIANAPAGWSLVHKLHAGRPELVVGYFGNIRGPKQIQALVDAASRVQETGRDVRLLFAGVGPEADMVRRIADQLRFVKFTGAYDYASEYAGLHGQADLVYAMYPQETPNYRTHIARRFHESVLSGMPVIVTRGTHMGDIVRKSGVGWEVTDQSVDELADLLSRLYDDRRELAKATADEDLRERHRFETYVPLLLSAHQRAVESRRAG